MTVIQSRGNEALRQTYLRALGVQSYFPRRALPGAKVSSVYASEVGKREMLSLSLEAGVQSSAQAVMEQPAVKPQKEMPQSKLETLDRSTAIEPSTGKPAMAELSAAESPVAEDVKFAFAYFPVNEELAIINELPWAKSAVVANSTRQLLASILKALGVVCEEKDLSSMVFSWPMPDMPLEELGTESARLTLEGFLGRRFKLRPVRHLLVLAEQSAGFLFPPNFSSASEEPLFRHPHFDVSVTLTRSLNAMEAVPEIKRVVWQQLQPLKAALDNGNASQPTSSPIPSQDQSSQDNS